MEQIRLVPHPTTPCPLIRAVHVTLQRESASELSLRYTVAGNVARLKVPPPGSAARTDGLWRETCFEAFLAAGDSAAYSEFNFAPSSAWAAYAFDGYRAAMRAIEPVQPPLIRCSRSMELLEVDVRLTSASLAAPDMRLALSAVLQDSDGRTSYWALAHPPGKPDFHDAAGFVGGAELGIRA